MVRCKECPIVLSSVDLLSHSGNQFPWSVGCFKSKVDLDFKAIADHLLRQNCCFFPPSTNIHNQCFMHDPAVEWILLWLDLPPQRWLSRHKASFSMSLSYPPQKKPTNNPKPFVNKYATHSRSSLCLKLSHSLVPTNTKKLQYTTQLLVGRLISNISH